MMKNTKIKRTSILLLVLLMTVMSFTFVSFGASKEPVMDYINVFNDEDLENLNEYGAAISDSLGIDIAILITDDSYSDDQDLAEYARECYFAHRNLSENGIILAADNDEWTWEMLFFGSAAGLLDEEEMEEIYEAYNYSDTFFDGVVGYYQTIEEILHSKSLDIVTSEGAYLVRDYSGILSVEEVNSLADKLLKVSNKHDFDVVVLIVPELDGREAHLYAADFFEENGYGRGNNDGCILVVATEDRDFGFTALGFGNTAFTPVGQQYFDGFYLPHLRDDNFFEAFMAYGDAADDFLSAAATGNPYDEGNIPGQSKEEPKSKRGIFGVGSLIISALAAFITTGRWKGQLKSVRKQTGARKYIKQGSMNLTNQRDVFLYRNHSSVIIPKKEEGSKGQSFKTSSGSKATGHSGKF